MLSTAAVGPAQMALDLMNAIDAAIIAAGGAWSFVEQWSPSGTPTTIYRVYKCSGLVNSGGADFYISVMRSSNTSNLFFQMFEQYNSTTHTLTDAVPGVLSGTTGVGSDTVPTSRYTTGWSGTLDASVSPWYGSWNWQVNTSTGTGATYWISVTNDRIIIFTTVSNGVYLGCYDRLQSPAIDPVPIIGQQLGLQSTFQYNTNNPNTTGPGYTREPFTSQSQYNWIAGIVPLMWQPANPYKDWLSGQLWPSKLLCLVNGARNGSTGFASARGFLKDLLYQQLPAGGIGDVMAVDGVTYVRAPNSLWLNSAA